MSLELTIISILGAIAWGLLFYLIKKQDSEIDEIKCKIEENKNLLISHKTKIQKLDLLSIKENVLKDLIKEAVRNAFNEWELELTRKGYLHTHKEN
jgi:hypothetical protein